MRGGGVSAQERGVSVNSARKTFPKSPRNQIVGFQRPNTVKIMIIGPLNT